MWVIPAEYQLGPICDAFAIPAEYRGVLAGSRVCFLAGIPDVSRLYPADKNRRDPAGLPVRVPFCGPAGTHPGTLLAG